MEIKTIILIVGGYGKVGQKITRLLSDTNYYHLCVAGRNKTKSVAKDIGANVSGIRFDINKIEEAEKDILSKVKAVVVCVDQINNNFVCQISFLLGFSSYGNSVLIFQYCRR